MSHREEFRRLNQWFWIAQKRYMEADRHSQEEVCWFRRMGNLAKRINDKKNSVEYARQRAGEIMFVEGAMDADLQDRSMEVRSAEAAGQAEEND